MITDQGIVASTWLGQALVELNFFSSDLLKIHTLLHCDLLLLFGNSLALLWIALPRILHILLIIHLSRGRYCRFAPIDGEMVACLVLMVRSHLANSFRKLIMIDRL